MTTKKEPLTFYTTVQKIDQLTQKAAAVGISRSAYINSILHYSDDKQTLLNNGI
jgi:hypothetical protein